MSIMSEEGGHAVCKADDRQIGKRGTACRNEVDEECQRIEAPCKENCFDDYT